MAFSYGCNETMYLMGIPGAFALLITVPAPVIEYGKIIFSSVKFLNNP